MVSLGSVSTLRQYNPGFLLHGLEHQTCTCAWLQAGGRGGAQSKGGLYIFHMLLETGALYNIEPYSREGPNRERTVILFSAPTQTNMHQGYPDLPNLSLPMNVQH